MSYQLQHGVQVIPSAWDSILGSVTIVAVVGMVSSWIGEKLTPEEELLNLNSEISKVAARLHDTEENAAHAREHFSKLMATYGYGVIPSEMEMRKHLDMKIQKKRWDELEKKAERTRGYLFKLIRRRKEITGEA